MDAHGWGVLVLAVAVLSWICYWCSHHVTLVLWARQITEDRNPYVFDVTSEQARLAGLPMPKVYEIEPLFPYAHAVGRCSRQAVIVVSSSLQRKLDRRQLGAVLAHEMAHVRNHDTLVGTVTMTVVGIVLAVSILLDLQGWVGAIVLLLPAVSWLLESRADTTATDACGDSPRAGQRLTETSSEQYSLITSKSAVQLSPTYEAEGVAP